MLNGGLSKGLEPPFDGEKVVLINHDFAVPGSRLRHQTGTGCLAGD